MASENETIADIVAEMRGPYYKICRSNVSLDKDMMGYMSFMANRIEAAAKREREAGAEAAQICGEIGELIGREAACKEKVTDCNHLGNAAAMREALERCASMGDQIDNQLGSSEDTVYAFRGERCLAHNISECARAALSAPPRNCDVGTADEQVRRHLEWCKRNLYKCHSTPSCAACFAEWAQLSYDEGSAK